jgi:CHAT domain-containing protein
MDDWMPDDLLPYRKPERDDTFVREGVRGIMLRGGGLGCAGAKRGAHGVLAALWPVADQSTAELMPEMYRLREENKLSKAEALRQAQVEFIHGRAATEKPGSQRAAPREVAQSKTPFAHPYFWAPFILMGNWL